MPPIRLPMPRRHLSYSSELEINSPTPNQPLLPVNYVVQTQQGDVQVEITKLTQSARRFVGKVFDATVPPNNRPLPANLGGGVPNDCFELTHVDGTPATSFRGSFTLAAAADPPVGNNKVVVVGAYDNSN